MTGLQYDTLDAEFRKAANRLLHRFGLACNDRHRGGILVSRNHISVEGLDDSQNRLERRRDARHQTLVGDVDATHLSTSGRRCAQRVVEFQNPRNAQCGVLTETVPSDHVGVDSVLG